MRVSSSPLGKIRLQAGFLSARVVADLIGCSTTHMHQLERGRTGGSRGLRGRLAGLYRVPIEEIDQAVKECRKNLTKRMAEAHK